MADYEAQSVSSLKSLLTSRGLKTAGNKVSTILIEAALIQRLKEDDLKKSDTEHTEKPVEEPVKETDDKKPAVYTKPSHITLENIGLLSMEERLEMRRRRFGSDTLEYKLKERKLRFASNNKPEKEGEKQENK